MYQGSCGQCSKWAHQSVLKILQYTPELEVSACRMDTILNYCPIYSNSIFEAVLVLLFIILCIQEERKLSKPGVPGRVEIQNFPRALLPGSPPGFCPGPAGGTHSTPSPLAAIQQVYGMCKSLL